MLTDLLTVALVSASTFLLKFRKYLCGMQGENKNFLPVSPKSSPNDIKNVLGISKSYVVSQEHDMVTSILLSVAGNFGLLSSL